MLYEVITIQLRQQVAPGLAHCLLATWQGHRRQAVQPAAMAVVAIQDFAAPDGVFTALGGQAAAIENESQHRRRRQRLSVVRQTGGQVGVMMLHRLHRQPGLSSQAPAEIAGVGIAGQQPGRAIQQSAEAFKCLTQLGLVSYNFV